MVGCDRAVRSFFGNLAISNILKILEQLVSRHLASSALELRIVKQVELRWKAQLTLVEALDPLK